jgi:tryptophan halogenase
VEDWHQVLWGPRGRFDYTFSQQLDSQWSDLPRPNGFYCDAQFRGVDLAAALIANDKVWERNPKGGRAGHSAVVRISHREPKLVDILEVCAVEAGIEIIDGTMSSAERGPEGIAAIHLEDGRRLEADLFIDASGFRSELLGRTLEEPFVSFDRSLFCDRAVVGGWERTTEPILPYTTAETMDAGWAWQIEHEHIVNRGYVFSSQAISDEAAAEEFKRKNPKVPKDLRVVKIPFRIPSSRVGGQRPGDWQCRRIRRTARSHGADGGVPADQQFRRAYGALLSCPDGNHPERLQ